jgi:hypothetical protein
VPDPGLCGDCLHARVVETGRSRFFLCLRHADEPARYRKYPQLPVLRCAGHEKTHEASKP